MQRTINMLSRATSVKGQGVGSAYEEQVSLVQNNLKDMYKVEINQVKFADIRHYHTINLEFFLTIPFTKIKSSTVGYVHFLPETLESSIKLPRFAKKVFYKYVISFYKSMDYLITVNPYFIDKLVAYGINREKITYIPNYVSSKRFYKIDKKSKNSIRKKYHVDSKKFVVLCVGQLQTRKGVADFIEVAKMLPDIEFVWAGGFSFKKISDGYSQIKKLTENPPSNVKFLGIVPREEMNEVYNMADIMFLPSYEELFPMTVLESANCKLPILLRDIELYKGILEGYYLKGKNNLEFKNEIEKLSQDQIYYNKASQMAHECSKYYSEENVAKMWRAYYNKIYKRGLKKTWRKRNEN
ncbi:MAG: glycosyltransferase family 4 protein [Clostridia bacterium]|nr:glycosyltransferase family 4 protein [Clostridia bacterium]